MSALVGCEPPCKHVHTHLRGALKVGTHVYKARLPPQRGPDGRVVKAIVVAEDRLDGFRGLLRVVEGHPREDVVHHVGVSDVVDH